jgi:RNA polymerase sigma factor (TIGR02999 family)
LIDQNRAVWQDRAQFFRVASHMMRRILIDRARAHRMQKRSGQWTRVTLGEAVALARGTDVDLIDLDRALNRLATFDPRMSEIAELRFFGGLTLTEIGDLLGLSRSTVDRDWEAARAWLFNELSGQHHRDPDPGPA